MVAPGDGILFSRRTRLQAGMYWLPLADGQPSGEPRQVLGLDQPLVRPIGFTAAGAYVYGQPYSVNDLVRGHVDALAGVLDISADVAANLSPTSSADWSPSGRALAWVTGDNAPGDAFRRLVVLEEATGTLVQAPLRLQERHGYHPRWISETELVTDGWDTEGRHALFRIEATTGVVTEIVPIESACADECAAWQWNAATGIILWVSDGRSIEVRGPAPEQREELYRASDSQQISRLSLSPDGSSLAFVLIDREDESTHLYLLPTSGGPVRERFRVAGIETRYVPGGTRVAWSRDGSFLLLGRSHGVPGVPIEFWYVPADGSSPQRLAHSLEAPSLFGLSIHPDGRTLALSVGQPGRSEIWLSVSLWLPYVMTC